MSARVIESPVPDAAASVLWRKAGTPPGPPAAQASVEQAGPAPAASGGPGQAGAPQARVPDRNWEAEMEQKIRAAQQAGYNQGLNDGITQGTERIQPVLKSLAGIIQEVSQLKPKYRQEAEASAVGLALAVAKRILYREIATDPEAILGLVKSAFDKINARETHRLRLSPEDVAVVQQHVPKIGLPPGVAIVGDPKLARGSAVFETSRGDLDASMDTQLMEIERGFADLIRRRAG